MHNTAFNYLAVNICKIKKTEISDRLGVDKSEITNIGKRKRGVENMYIPELERLFGVPQTYWLDEKPVVSGNQIRTRYVKKLTKEVKQKIDAYLSYKKFKSGQEIENEIGVNPYMKEVLSMDTDIVFEEMKHLMYSIVYSECKDEYYDELFYNRALSLQEMLESIKEIGIDNMWEYAKALKEKRFKPVGMTEAEIKEYELLFGMIKNTPE